MYGYQTKTFINNIEKDYGRSVMVTQISSTMTFGPMKNENYRGLTLADN